MIKFQVFPGRDNHMAWESELYFDVRVYKTQASMAKKWKETNPHEEHDWGKLYAGVLPSKTFINNVLSPRLGLVLFCDEHMNFGIVAHEAVHMATEYLRRARRSVRLKSYIDDNEERLAYAAGTCAKQIARRVDNLWD